MSDYWGVGRLFGVLIGPGQPADKESGVCTAWHLTLLEMISFLGRKCNGTLDPTVWKKIIFRHLDSDAWLNSIMWQIYFQSNLNLFSVGSSVQTLIQGRIICRGLYLRKYDRYSKHSFWLLFRHWWISIFWTDFDFTVTINRVIFN